MVVILMSSAFGESVVCVGSIYTIFHVMFISVSCVVCLSSSSSQLDRQFYQTRICLYFGCSSPRVQTIDVVSILMRITVYTMLFITV